MSSIEVGFNIRELSSAISNLASRAQNITDLNAQGAAVLANFVDDKFENEGPGWDKLSAHTLSRRRNQGAGARILQDTGILANSISQESGVDYCEVFTNVPYAVFPITGTPRAKLPNPKRDFFDIDMDKAIDLIGDIITDEISGGT